MTGFVSPFVGRVARLSFRIRVGNHQNRIEVQQGVREYDFPLDFSDVKIQSFVVFVAGGVEFLLQFVQLSDFVGQINVFRQIGNAVSDFFRPFDFVGDFARVKLVVRLERPVDNQVVLSVRRKFVKRDKSRGVGNRANAGDNQS